MILTGRVRSYYLKQIAQEVTRKVLNGSGNCVENHIEVIEFPNG